MQSKLKEKVAIQMENNPEMVPIIAIEKKILSVLGDQEHQNRSGIEKTLAPHKEPEKLEEILK
jgi:hypothetical protein